MRISGIVLDVNETLFSLEPVERRFGEVGLDANQVGLWFARVLRDGFALAATDAVESFPAIGRHHLKELLSAAGVPATDEAASEVLAAFDEVAPHPDVAQGLRAAHLAGLSVTTLTNGTVAVTRGFLDRAELSSLVDTTREAQTCGVWKPHPRAYRWAAEQAGHQPEELLLVTVHPWDVHGARSAGLAAGWLDREGRAYPSHFRSADVRAATLAGVIAAATDRQGPSHA